MKIFLTIFWLNSALVAKAYASEPSVPANSTLPEVSAETDALNTVDTAKPDHPELDQEQLAEQQRAVEQLRQHVAYCAPCHGQNGISRESIYPDLAEQPADYLLSQLQAYKYRQRTSEIKQVMMQRFSDQQLAALAEYYSQSSKVEQQ
ncbi:cytochrome c [Thalassotalea maritima]|uniref:c-type cytochrome n=1 Tax=Thalassotalea maritima TaxID=3242416 RepID=UPI003529C3E7